MTKPSGGGGHRRKGCLSFYKWLVFVLVLTMAMVVPLGVYAVQNIFVDSSQIVDIQVGSDKIDQVYVGSTLVWQRNAETGDYIQTVTTDRCPTVRTRVVDARDNASYWVQKMADGKCWMLTNLAYGGGGVNTYNDVKIINLNSTNTGPTFTSPEYYIPTGANKTTEPADPSTSTTGIGQYGYLYNWCAAMGAQATTSACMDATTPAPYTNISICPSGWRLPGGGATATTAGNDFGALNMAVNGGTTTSDYGLKSTWLGMYGGDWYNGFSYQGNSVRYWSFTQNMANSVYTLVIGWSGVAPGVSSGFKLSGYAVRCVAV